jgi:hypothetical protein
MIFRVKARVDPFRIEMMYRTWEPPTTVNRVQQPAFFGNLPSVHRHPFRSEIMHWTRHNPTTVNRVQQPAAKILFQTRCKNKLCH